MFQRALQGSTFQNCIRLLQCHCWIHRDSSTPSLSISKIDVMKSLPVETAESRTCGKPFSRSFSRSVSSFPFQPWLWDSSLTFKWAGWSCSWFTPPQISNGKDRHERQAWKTGMKFPEEQRKNLKDMNSNVTSRNTPKALQRRSNQTKKRGWASRERVQKWR